MADIPTTMRAWTITSRGSPLTNLLLRKDVPIPKVTWDTSVLVRISHVSLHPGTSLLMHLIPRFFRRTPYIAETDFAGTVVAVGTSVPVSPPNDQADSITQHGIGIGTKTFGSIPVPVHLSGSGALAEYLAIETKHITPIPSTLSLAQASTLPVSAITALDVVSLCNPQSGQRILINSPTGGVGSFATQLLRRAVGSEGVIVGICSQAGAGLARELGCDEVGDYGNYCDGSSVYERLEVYCREHGRFDAVVDCYGSQMLWGWSESLLKEGREGVYATVGPRFPSMSYWGMLVVLWQMMGNMLRPRWMGGVDRTYRQAASFIDEEKFDKVRKLAENGVIKPVVGEAFAFEDAKEAYEVMLSGHSKGKIVIEVDGFPS